MGKKWKQWQILFSWAPKSLQTVIAAMKVKDACSLGRKAMTSLDRVLKSKGLSLTTKVHIVKAMVFPVVMYRYKRWPTKKAEHQRIDAFKLWCWRRLLRAPWTPRRSNQSMLKETNPESSLEGLMLKLKLQYFGHLMWRVNSLEKTLILGKMEGKRRRGGKRMRCLLIQLNGHEFEQTLGDSGGQRNLVYCSPWSHKELNTT